MKYIEFRLFVKCKLVHLHILGILSWMVVCIAISYAQNIFCSLDKQVDI